MLSDRRIVIVTGGKLGPWITEEIRDGDYVVGVDKGALMLLENGVVPDFVLGDFDSVTEEELAKIQHRCPEVKAFDPIDKDYTDTELAFNWSLQQQPREILLLGALGDRVDHTLANIHLLHKALTNNTPCIIKGKKNRVMLIDSPTVLMKERFAYVTLLPLSTKVMGITLTGFKYPLQNATLTIGQSLGVSNVLLGDTGTINLTQGELLVIQSSD